MKLDSFFDPIILEVIDIFLSSDENYDLDYNDIQLDPKADKDEMMMLLFNYIISKKSISKQLINLIRSTVSVIYDTNQILFEALGFSDKDNLFNYVMQKFANSIEIRVFLGTQYQLYFRDR
jgi:hypothetical protein